MSDSFEITRKLAVYVASTFTVRVRSRFGLVYALFGNKPLKMTTTEAHDRGFKMVKLAGEAEPGELIIVKINGSELQFPPSNARQVGGALLRKADDADDFQIGVRIEP